ncbi:unnamed protein product [Arabidopsis halleri]
MRTRLIVLNILIRVMIVARSDFSATRDDDIDRLLKKLNKPALKSIKMRPSSYPEEWNNLSSNSKEQSSMVTQLWTINGKCPKNSIPIIRTRREDILRAKSIERYGKKDLNNIHQLKQENATGYHEYAIIKVKGKFYGGRALINVWKPFVQTTREFSLAQMWVMGGVYDSQFNTIEAGWQVYPNRYNDTKPHYFIYWTSDAYQTTGCYNLACPGFVLINQKFAIGAPVREVSTLDGTQYHIPTTIWKDPRSGHWWLKFSTHTLVGYWPASLFNKFQNGATEVHWGGEILDFKDGSKHSWTQMGSGRFAQEGYQKASYFRNVEVINERELPQQPVGAYPVATHKNCYTVELGNHLVWGTFFYHGGPGRNPNCR